MTWTVELTPERIREMHGKDARLCRTDRFIAIISLEVWKGGYFSRRGYVAHAPASADTAWIGAALRQAIGSSEYFDTPGKDLDWAELRLMEEASNARRIAFEEDVARTYGFKTAEAAFKTADLVFVEWRDLVDDFIVLLASRRLPGRHSAWNKFKRPDKFIKVSVSASNEALGLAGLDALSRCEGLRSKPTPLEVAARGRKQRRVDTT